MPDSTFRSTLPFLTRIVAALLLVALVPLLFASWRLISVNRDSMELQVKATQIVAARTASDAIATFVATRRALARSIAESPVLATADSQAISGLLQGSLQAWSNLEIEAVALFDAANQMLIGSRVSGSQLDLGQWLASVPNTTDAALEIEGARVLFILREPLPGGGSVLLLGDTNALQQPLEPSQLIDDSEATVAVFDSDGRRLAGSVEDFVMPTNLMEQALSGSVEGSGVYRTDDQEAFISAFSGIEGTDWTVIAMQPRAVAERITDRMRTRALTALGVALALILLLVAIAYRWLVKPLRSLLVAQRRLAKSRVSKSGGNLIRELEQSFEDLENRLEDQRDLGEVFLGRYQVLEMAGRGGMGTVFRGWDPELERYVALKTVRFDKLALGNTGLVDALLKEAKTTAKLQHSNIVQVFDVASAKKSAFVAMEFVDGISLEGWIQTGLPEPRSIIPVMLAVAEGLGVAHQHDILHRDIKAANVLLGYDGSLKITDFGLAKLISGHQPEEEMVFGTPGHIAPEVLLGLGIDKPSDIFSLGVVTHYMLTGYTPFRGSNVKDTLKRTLKGKLSRPSHLRAEIPQDLEDLMLGMLSGEPDKRPTAADLVTELRAMEVEHSIEWRAPKRARSAPLMPEASAAFVETQQVAP